MSNRQYLVNLTNNLIAKNGYDQFRVKKDDFRRMVANDLSYGGDVFRMSPAKLGEVMATFDVGDVPATKEELFELVSFAGDPESMLRDLVAACLAFYIDARLNYAEETGVTPYRRRAA